MTRGPTRLAAWRDLAWDSNALCVEDFRAGQVFTLGRRPVSREQVIAFARQYDPQPFHLDERAAQATLLKGLAASGWHTCAMLMRMLSDGLLERGRFAGLLGIDEIRWLLPVRPGDVLLGRAICLGTGATSPWPGLGVVEMRCEALNGDGQRVMWWHAHLAFEQRDRVAAEAAEPRRRAPVRSAERKPGEHGIKFFEDVGIGEEIALGQHCFSADAMAAFRNAYDPSPAHSEAAGERPCASCWHIAAVWMRRLVSHYCREEHKLRTGGQPVPELGPSPGIRRMAWHRPVHAGDTLSFTTWAERKRELPIRSGWGLLIGAAEAVNQHGEIVMSFLAELLLERRDRVRRLDPSGP